MVLDDVGGLGGFARFLKGINQNRKPANLGSEECYEEYGEFSDKAESLAWARSLGWSKRRTVNRNLL